MSPKPHSERGPDGVPAPGRRGFPPWLVALALGAGTQVFTLGIASALLGTSELTTDLSLGAGRRINLAIAEYAIRRPRSRRTRRIELSDFH